MPKRSTEVFFFWQNYCLYIWGDRHFFANAFSCNFWLPVKFSDTLLFVFLGVCDAKTPRLRGSTAPTHEHHKSQIPSFRSEQPSHQQHITKNALCQPPPSQRQTTGNQTRNPQQLRTHGTAQYHHQTQDDAIALVVYTEFTQSTPSLLKEKCFA